MKVNARWVPWFLVAAALGLFAAEPAIGRVLILHSYHAEFDWVQGINDELMPSLEAAGIPFRTFYMDTKRRSGMAWKKESARLAKEIIDTYAPDVVIAVDDNAQEHVVRDYCGRSPIQFVFAGVNADPETYGYPAPNVTGILERTYPGQTLNLLKIMLAKPVHLVWISDDSATSSQILQRVRPKAEKGQLPLPVDAFERPSTFRQWKTAIGKYDDDPHIGGFLIPLYHTVRTHADGPSMEPAKVMQWTVAHTRKPVVGLWRFGVDDGAVGAVVVDPKEHGKVAGLMARQIHAGKKAAEMPLVTNREGFVIINIAAAGRLGIEVPFEVLLSADKIIE